MIPPFSWKSVLGAAGRITSHNLYLGFSFSGYLRLSCSSPYSYHRGSSLTVGIATFNWGLATLVQGIRSGCFFIVEIVFIDHLSVLIKECIGRLNRVFEKTTMCRIGKSPRITRTFLPFKHDGKGTIRIKSLLENIWQFHQLVVY